MNKHGGKRDGAGRKSKADEQSLIEKLTPLEPLAFEALKSALNDKKDWAVKLTFEYMYGKPKQQIDQNTNHSFEGTSIKDYFKIDNT